MQTDRTIPNNKPDIIIGNNEKATYMLIDVAISVDGNVIKKEAKKILKYKDFTIEILRMWNVKTEVMPVVVGATGTISKCHTSNNRGNWNHFQIIQKIPEQNTGKARNQGTTENSHIGHCTHTSESTNVKVQ